MTRAIEKMVKDTGWKVKSSLGNNVPLLFLLQVGAVRDGRNL
jgi:hypothetical protein